MAKSKKNIQRNKIDDVEMDFNVKNKIFVVIGILCFFLLFYLLTLYLTYQKKDSSDDTKAETPISYEKILVGRSLSVSDGEYYVLFYETSDEDISSKYSELYNNYKSSSQLPIYYVDMSSGFNNSFKTTEEANRNPSSAADFLINGPTLVRVNDHKVVEYVEGEESITEHLKTE